MAIAPPLFQQQFAGRRALRSDDETRGVATAMRSPRSVATASPRGAIGPPQPPHFQGLHRPAIVTCTAGCLRVSGLAGAAGDRRHEWRRRGGAAGAPVVQEAETGVTAEAVEKPKADPWKLEPQPIREDQVENAVKFLSHPKVRTSPIVHRRSFLEKKGLTREEIDEAFRRVPDPPSSEVAATAVSSRGIPSSQPMVPAQSAGAGQVQVASKPRELSWGQKLLGLGAIVAAGAGAGVITKVFLLPKFKSWVRSILVEESETDKKVSPPSPAPSAEPPVNEAALAANAAAAAASEVAAAMREFSQARVKESLQLGSIIKALESQTQELKSALSGMRDVVNNSESVPTTFVRGYRQDPWRTPEMPRPSGMLSDRPYAAVITPPSSERIKSGENGTESGVTE